MNISNLNGEATWGNLPEYILDSQWISFFKIPPVTYNYIGTIPSIVDAYIEEINIPQIGLSSEKSSLGLLSFTEFENYSTITITYCDDVNGTMNLFFDKWIDGIYDREKFCFRKQWVRRYIDIKVQLLRYMHSGNIMAQKLTHLGTNFGGVGTGISGVLNNLGVKNSYSSFALQNVERKDSVGYILERCYPTKKTELSLSQSAGGDRLQFSVELECRKVQTIYPSIKNSVF